MRRIALIYNPVAGTRRRQRAADVEAAARVFREHQADVRVIGTESSGSAGHSADPVGRRSEEAIANSRTR